ncbi:MAG: hypothetical protein IJN14_05500 [Ruminococcus sp.]|nr:hypothetical protein [Ruminococcus sp.]
MKKLIKLLLILILLSYGGDILRDGIPAMPSRSSIEGFAVQLGDSISDFLETLGFQPPSDTVKDS